MLYTSGYAESALVDDCPRRRCVAAGEALLQGRSGEDDPRRSGGPTRFRIVINAKIMRRAKFANDPTEPSVIDRAINSGAAQGLKALCFGA